MSDHAIPRRFETPNAVMYTYASRDLTGSELAVWRVEMAPGAAGPAHVVDAEQVLVVLEGAVELVRGDASEVLEPGGSAVLRAGEPRRLRCPGPAPLAAMVSTLAGARVSADGKENVPLPWGA